MAEQKQEKIYVSKR